MATFILFSHDGYGLGHVRRNTLIARALVARDSAARVVVVTGSPARPGWLDDPRFSVVAIPPLVKDSAGVYRNPAQSFESAVDQRAAIFRRVVHKHRPDVVLVDRHPFGTRDELRDGLGLARTNGATILLGLRDVLDSAETVADELSGAGWADVQEVYSQALVYGSPVVCDHEREYGIPLPITYCGWVTSTTPSRTVDPELVVVAAGGGADGDDVLRLGFEVMEAEPHRRAIVVAGPYANNGHVLESRRTLGRRVRFSGDTDGCVNLFARAGVVIQMGGYNTTYEALSAGSRPIIVPRRSPRREQVIRASRLAALGVADVVDAGVSGAEVGWLLNQPRRLPSGILDDRGLTLDGAENAAKHMIALVRERVA